MSTFTFRVIGLAVPAIRAPCEFVLQYSGKMVKLQKLLKWCKKVALVWRFTAIQGYEIA